MQALRRVAIVSATRTPIGAFGGSLKALKNHDLAAIAIKDVRFRGIFCCCCFCFIFLFLFLSFVVVLVVVLVV